MIKKLINTAKKLFTFYFLKLKIKTKHDISKRTSRRAIGHMDDARDGIRVGDDAIAAAPVDLAWVPVRTTQHAHRHVASWCLANTYF